MITRREFLKLAGTASAALLMGGGAAKLFSERSSVYQSFAAFIPAQGYSMEHAVKLFCERIKINADPIISAEPGSDKALKYCFKKYSSQFPKKDSAVFIHLAKAGYSSAGDLLINNSGGNIINPSLFSDELLTFRNYIRTQKADYLLTMEYSGQNFSYPSKNNFAVIENEKGIYDRINLSKDYSVIAVPGINGKVEISIKDKNLKFHKAECRNKICTKLHGISGIGEFAACAPNKVFIRIENA